MPCGHRSLPCVDVSFALSTSDIITLFSRYVHMLMHRFKCLCKLSAVPLLKNLILLVYAILTCLARVCVMVVLVWSWSCLHVGHSKALCVSWVRLHYLCMCAFQWIPHTKQLLDMSAALWYSVCCSNVPCVHCAVATMSEQVSTSSVLSVRVDSATALSTADTAGTSLVRVHLFQYFVCMMT